MPSGRLIKLGVVLDAALQRLEANCTSMGSVQATTAIIQTRRANKYATDSRLQNFLEKEQSASTKKAHMSRFRKIKAAAFYQRSSNMKLKHSM